MKNIFNEADKNEIIQRIEKLTPSTQALWGKMDVAQMLAHCAAGTKLPTGEIRPASVPFPVRIFGRLIKSKVLAADEMNRSTPTMKEVMITEAKDFDKEKQNFIAGIIALYQGGEKVVKMDKHPFFGKMSPGEWGRLNYIHANHHLRQFGV